LILNSDNVLQGYALVNNPNIEIENITPLPTNDAMDEKHIDCLELE
jgi:hypothetical protein